MRHQLSNIFSKSGLVNAAVRGLAMSTIFGTAILHGAAANAQSIDREVSFKYSKVELETEESVADLYDRMEARARFACRPTTTVGALFISFEAECKDDVMNQFISQIEDEALSAYHETQLLD